GSRLWPLSRNDYPKQFLRLCSPITMLQETINRLEGLDCEDPIIICNQKHKYIVKEQLLSFKIKHSAILLEPVGRNTAPAIGLAAFEAMGQKGDVLLLVLSADHLIKNIECFHKAVNKSLKFALDNYLVTFGVTPTRAETCYGYIRKGALIDRSAYQISSFVEKPDQDKAESFFKSDDYLWNSGMFLFKASCYLRELKRYRPDIYHSCMFAINNKNIDGDFINIAHEKFIQCPSESIDYAVMEKTDNAVVMPLASEWSDVGNFPSLWENSIKDCNNNYVDSNVFTSD
ncbi:mannose-1-phosphate guanylyltransferase/mannose-6-phosphate isomerase, partial [Escherichia coli]|nr:mannose-1-phosphate guanylyltransferase/mannose-6-phosphate isomerase [Escherichia coli]